MDKHLILDGAGDIRILTGPEVGRRVGDVHAQPDINNMKRIVINNIVLTLLYFALFLAVDVYYVRTGQADSLLFMLGEIALYTLPASAFLTTWFSHRRRDRSRRFLASAGVALLVTIVAFLFLVTAGIPFHMWISGAW